jgi:hypothetical protein
MCIASISLSPSLFEDRHPNLIFIRLAKDRFSFVIYRHEVINQNLFDDSIHSQHHSIDSVINPFLLSENGEDPLLFLR